MKLLERTISLSLLCWMLIVAARFQVFMHYTKELKSEFRARILSNGVGVSELTIPGSSLYIDNAGLEWKDDNKEVVIDGVWHEVLAVKNKGSRAIIYLIEDRAETAMVNRFFTEEKESGELAGFYHLLCGFVFTSIGPAQFAGELTDTSILLFSQYPGAPADGFQATPVKPPCALI